MSPPVTMFCGNIEPHEAHQYAWDHGSTGVYQHVCYGVPVGPTKEGKQ